MSEMFTNPVAPGADPFILKDGDTYYLYPTSGDAFGYRVFTSNNLVEWTAQGYCLLYDDIYTDSSKPTDFYGFWAPELIKYNDKYYIICSVQNHLAIAVSDSPLGPFKNDADSFLLPYEAIDGNFFLDKDGQMYLYFATLGKREINGQTVPYGEGIWGAKLNMETLKLDEETIKLLVLWDRSIEIHEPVVEGPFMIENDGTYYLTFSSDGYPQTNYSVQYAISDSPLGDFTRSPEYVTLRCDDLDRADVHNPHFYGTGHHSFFKAPNGKDWLIVYHCHRASFTYNKEMKNLVGPRSVCVDRVWFDENGRLLAGRSDKPTVPTAIPQPLIDGLKLERKTHFEGTFACIPSLPTLYVAPFDGSDENDGSKAAPLLTVKKAAEMLENGGRIILTQSLNCPTLFEIPKLNGPLCITAEHNNVVISFKYIKLHSAVYFDNVIFAPETVNEISVIECNFNDVVMGEGASTLNRPHGRDYPYLIGGKWQYSGSNINEVYEKFMYDEKELVTDKECNITLYGGKWEKVIKGNF